MKIVVAVVVILLVLLYVVWVLRQARISSCPNCAKDGEDAPLLPVLFNLLWWCPNCGEMQQSRILKAAVREASREQTMRSRLGGMLRRSKAAPAPADEPEQASFR